MGDVTSSEILTATIEATIEEATIEELAGTFRYG